MVENPYLGRIVVLLTPVFAGLAGWIAQLAAENLPGAPNLDSGELTTVFVAGAGVALGAVYKWLENRGKYELGQELSGAANAEDVAAAKQ